MTNPNNPYLAKLRQFARISIEVIRLRRGGTDGACWFWRPKKNAFTVPETGELRQACRGKGDE